MLRWDEYFAFVTTVQRRAWPLASSDKRRFFGQQFAAACNRTVGNSIGVPLCPGWRDGAGPSGHRCWDLGGNLSQYERFLFPSAAEPELASSDRRWQTDDARHHWHAVAQRQKQRAGEDSPRVLIWLYDCSEDTLRALANHSSAFTASSSLAQRPPTDP